MPVDLERIGMHDRDRLPGEFGLEHADEITIDLHCDDRRPGGDQAMRQRSEARPDLDNVIAVSNLGQTDDALDLVRVNEEVLAATLVGTQAVALEQLGSGSGTDGQSSACPQCGQGEAPWSE